MIKEAEKLKHLIQLARGATQKSLSQLTNEEKYAVMFLGDHYPARWDKGKIKYDRDAKQVVWSGSYVEVNKALKALDPEAKGFSSNAIHILIDEDLPRFKEASFKEALASEDLIPFKHGKYAHLPPLEKEKPTLVKDEVYRGIGTMLASLTVALHKDLELTPLENAVHFMCHKYEDTFKELCKSLGMPSYTILNYAPEYTRAARGTMDYDDTGSTASYLATYIYFASLGIKLKSKKEE